MAGDYSGECMLISTPQLSNNNNGSTLTPMMIRGAFILWRSELKRGQQLAEIKEWDFSPNAGQLTPRASGNFSILNRDENARD